MDRGIVVNSIMHSALYLLILKYTNLTYQFSFSIAIYLSNADATVVQTHDANIFENI